MSALQIGAGVAVFELVAVLLLLALAGVPELRRPLTRGERLMGWYCGGLTLLCVALLLVG